MRNIGDSVWVATVRQEQVEKTCPDCLGSGRWHCVLPNGEEFDCECARCSHGGYEPSNGKVKEDYTLIVGAEQATITGVKQVSNGQFEYDTTKGWSKKECDLHDTAELAEAQAKVQAQEWLDNEYQGLLKLARSRGRPRKKKDGTREANPMEFGGSAINYARSEIRRAIKEAARWNDFAKRKGADIDWRKMIEDALGETNKNKERP